MPLVTSTHPNTLNSSHPLESTLTLGKEVVKDTTHLHPTQCHVSSHIHPTQYTQLITSARIHINLKKGSGQGHHPPPPNPTQCHVSSHIHPTQYTQLITSAQSTLNLKKGSGQGHHPPPPNPMPCLQSHLPNSILTS